MTHVTDYRPDSIPVPEGADEQTREIIEGLYGDGIIAHKGALPRRWAEELAEDIDVAFTEALTRENGAVGRGPNRHYVEIHPEQIRGFVELVDHPWVRAV